MPQSKSLIHCDVACGFDVLPITNCLTNKNFVLRPGKVTENRICVALERSSSYSNLSTTSTNSSSRGTIIIASKYGSQLFLAFIVGAVCEAHPELQSDPLDLVLGEPFAGAIVKLGRARAFVRGHFLCVFECAAIGEI